ncbi:toll-like receptor Tollo [Pomacea canaliculata]|uniref:toll-like receptor Tollo n=1 Tax=Pomacea canaliculata TaxID=400727 RepID=UPI000D73EEF0|nr:toll-like receptor Tollo [Pomacea canaliculata]
MADCSRNGGRLQFVPVLPPIITSLNFSFNNLPHLSSDFFSNVTQLSFVDLTGNGLVSVDQHAFRGLDNLTTITLDSNFLDFNSLRPVLNVSTLIQLQMRNIRNITFIPENIFIEFPLPNLKQLVLAGSNLGVLYLSDFKPLKKLTYLDVGRQSSVRDKGDHLQCQHSPSLRQLDLSGNPYACTCSLRWFTSWLIDERRKFANFPKGYVCATVSSTSSGQVGKTQRNFTRFIGETDDHLKWHRNRTSSFQGVSDRNQSDLSLPNLNYFLQTDADENVSLPSVIAVVYLSDFVMSDQACLLSQSTSLLTAVLAAVLVVFMLTFLVLYKYRWHIRLALYEAFQRNPQQQQQQPEREYEYDVFVSYANEDVDWVRQELIPTLEGRYGLRLCVHQRDFPVGGNIIDNISTCVHASKRVLFVLSPHFARSRWCQFELVFCQNYVMERDDVLVLTLLAPISGRDMTDAISAMFKTTTYLAWGEEEDARKAFWGRLVLAFHDILLAQMA